MVHGGDHETNLQRRLARLRRWLARHLALTETTVILPRTDRHYVIALPEETDRARLFAAARAAPGLRPPYWSQIWSSGVALADAALTRRTELAGQSVLELGCGLGVTATALVEAGATIVATDYDLLPLTLCRYNVMRNAGRAPRTLTLDWCQPALSRLWKTSEQSGFAVIMAADVLYEGRDVLPMVALIDHFLASDGVVWLAEPGRRTARRFLNLMAAAGWRMTTEVAEGPWPDGGATPIGLHVLWRPAGVSRASELLGGWHL